MEFLKSGGGKPFLPGGGLSVLTWSFWQPRVKAEVLLFQPQTVRTLLRMKAKGKQARINITKHNKM